MKKDFPARLHILLARHSPLAVVIRRGPAKQVCTVLWNREDDTFELGQWLKGRIYERRSDLSPDGKYLIYFAMKGGETSTVISRAPWLKALEFYPMCGTWEGGGLFLTENRFWIDGHFSEEEPLIQSDEVQRVESHNPGDHFRIENGWQLIKDGWKFIEYSDSFKVSPAFEKPLPKGWVLRKIANVSFSAPQKGINYYYRDKHALINKESETLIDCSDWEWADLDGQSIVWTSKGCLYRSPIENAETIGTPKLLYDFNPLRFEAIEAPY